MVFFSDKDILSRREMVLIVYGFPNDICALRFEWAWQNPEKSIRLKHLVPMNKKFSLSSKINVLSKMLQLSPWNRMPLVVRWLKPSYKTDEFDKQLTEFLPSHMWIESGEIKILKSTSQQCNDSDDFISTNCQLCLTQIKTQDKASCPQCFSVFHITCIADHLLKQEEGIFVVPCSGQCPHCDSKVRWIDFIKKLMKHKVVDEDSKNIGEYAEIEMFE